nr:PREDICTED: juxtaposed with another zinc finger protein 1-like [Paralichthys olivaceus]
MTGIAAASFFSNSCRFGGCGLQFESLAELIVHIEDNHIDTDPRVLEKQEQQQPTYLALSYINRYNTHSHNAAQRQITVETRRKKKRNVNGIKYHAKNGHRTQIRVRKPFKCRCGKSYKTSQGLRHHTINFHPPVSTEILRKIQG